MKFTVTADAKAQIGQHKTLFASFTLLRDGEPMSSTIASGGILRVEKPTSAAKITDVKK